MKIAIRFSLLVVCLAALAFPAAGQTLYGAIAGPNATSNLFTLNPTTGALVSTIGPIGFAVTGMAFHPQTGVLYGATSNNSGASPNNLITINTTTGAGTVVGPFGTTQIADITFTSDGSLWGWCECSDDFASINTATGTVTIVAPSGIGTFGSGIAADAADTIWYAGDSDLGFLRTVNRFTGLTTNGPTLNGSCDCAVNALAFDSAGTLYGVVNAGKTGPTSLVTINQSTGNVTVLGLTVTNLDAIAFSGSFVNVPTLDKKFLALFGLLLAGAAILILRVFRP